MHCCLERERHIPYINALYIESRKMVVKKTFLILQYLEKYSSTIQQLAHGDWHGVNKQESYRLEEGEETGDGRAERSSPTGDGRQAVIPLTADADGTGSGSLLDSILSS